MSDRKTTPPPPPPLLPDPSTMMAPELERLVTGVADAVSARLEAGLGSRLDAFIEEVRAAEARRDRNHENLDRTVKRLVERVNDLEERLERVEARPATT